MHLKLKAILCLDIDGTLANHQGQIHPEDVRLLADFPETIQPILATGRNLGSAKGILQENHAFQKGFLPLAGVFMNGGAAYLPGEELFLQHTFPSELLQSLLDLSTSFQGSTFAFFTISTAYLVNPTPYSRKLAKNHHLATVESKIDSVPCDIVKMMVIEPDQEKIREIRQSTHEINAEITYSLPMLLEFTPVGIKKSATLLPLLKGLSLDHLPVYTAGDGQNDLGLFDLAASSFAPSTAHPKILKKANHIIQRDDHNGILPGIIEIMLEEISAF
jgi:Cof subfamily protein (haloacid dehalogenase superfamily)